MENEDIYKQIARSLDAWKRCVDNNNTEWIEKHKTRIQELIDELPHGSGLDSEWTLDFQKSNDKQLIFYMSYHCMDENGMYDGWVEFTLKVKASLQFDIDLFITGNFGKYQDVKEYLYDILN